MALAQSKNEAFIREVNAIIPAAQRFSLDLLFMRELSEWTQSETLALHINLYNSFVKNLASRVVVMARALMLVNKRSYEILRVGLLCEEISNGKGNHTIDEADQTFSELQASFEAIN